MPAQNFTDLQRIVKKLSGHPGLGMTLEESQAAKQKSPELYSQYLKLRREYNSAWRTLIKQAAGSKLLPYPKVVTWLAKQGFANVLPEGFTGLIDGEGNFYTTSGELIDGKPTVANFPKVRMNPDQNDSDANWVFLGVRPDGGAGSYFYTRDFKKQRHDQKFVNVRQLDLPGIRKKWLKYVKTFAITEPKCVASVVLEMLWQFTARIGTLGNSTYGIATLRCKHVKASSTGLTITYLGKDSVKAVHKLDKTNAEHKPLIKAIVEELAGKAPGDLLFTVNRAGKNLQVSPATVNRVWHSFGVPDDITVHKIRTYTATKLFASEMEALLKGPNRPTTQKEAAAAFKQLALDVGTKLNHVRRSSSGEKITGATALKSYIDADCQVAYWHNLGLPLPKYLQEYSNTL